MAQIELLGGSASQKVSMPIQVSLPLRHGISQPANVDGSYGSL
jgi:hypothetical protein